MPESKVFISKALVETSSIFSFMDCVVKSITKIISKLDALKEKNVEFYHLLLAKKQTTQRLNELGAEYDTQKEHIKVLTKELEM